MSPRIPTYSEIKQLDANGIRNLPLPTRMAWALVQEYGERPVLALNPTRYPDISFSFLCKFIASQLPYDVLEGPPRI